MERTLPLLTQKILPDIKKGKTVLVVAHANSLRGAGHEYWSTLLPCFPMLNSTLLQTALILIWTASTSLLYTLIRFVSLWIAFLCFASMCVSLSSCVWGAWLPAENTNFRLYLSNDFYLFLPTCTTWLLSFPVLNFPDSPCPVPSCCVLSSSTSGVVKYIDSLSEDEIKRVGIPNGIPLVFKFKMEGGKLTPIPQLMAEAPLTGEFLEKKVLHCTWIDRILPT